MHTGPTAPYRRPDALLPLTCVGLGVFALLDLINLPAGLLGIAGIGGFGGQPDEELVEISMLLRGLSALGQLVMFIITPIFFSMLVYRCAKNARALGFTHFNSSPGWCVGWFFIPFAHLIMPYKANGETWQTSRTPVTGENAHEWSLTPVGPLFTAWWLTWIFGNITNNTASRLASSENFVSYGMWMIPPAAALQVLSALLAMAVVITLVRKQNRQYNALREETEHAQEHSHV